jgi:vitamin B12/bleomycin/antimicrobial peptide transport system ATP-binding/permease protein
MSDAARSPDHWPAFGLGRQIAAMARLLRLGQCGKSILALVLPLVAVIAATTYAQIQLNAWNEPFYDSLTRKDVAAFLDQLGIFATLAGLLLVLNVSQRWLDLTLHLTLRRGLFLSCFTNIPCRAGH